MLLKTIENIHGNYSVYFYKCIVDMQFYSGTTYSMKLEALKHECL